MRIFYNLGNLLSGSTLNVFVFWDFFQLDLISLLFFFLLRYNTHYQKTMTSTFCYSKKQYFQFYPFHSLKCSVTFSISISRTMLFLSFIVWRGVSVKCHLNRHLNLNNVGVDFYSFSSHYKNTFKSIKMSEH